MLLRDQYLDDFSSSKVAVKTYCNNFLCDMSSYDSFRLPDCSFSVRHHLTSSQIPNI